MRLGVLRGFGAALGVVFVGGGSVGNALAAPPQLFPFETHLVPVVVAAVFILPAIVACSMSALRRVRRPSGALLAVGVIAAMVAVVMYADPQLLASLRG